MRKLILLFLTGIFTVGKSFCGEQINLQVFDRAPKIDGILNEACWKKASVFDIVSSIDGRFLKDRWKAYAGCDQTAIYIGIDADVSEPDRILSSIKVRDGRVWKDDCFEIMIDYRNRGTDYAQFLINADSIRCDLLRFSDSGTVEPSNFDGDWSGVCRIKGEKIFAEFKIPYAIFDLYEKKDQDFRINICRENRYQYEYSSISGTFHEMDKFYVLKNLPFPHILKQIGIHDVNWGTHYGSNILGAKVKNSTDRIITYRAVMIAKNGFLMDTETTGKLKPGETLEIKKKYVITGPPGIREMTFSLIDIKNGRVLRSVSRVFQLCSALSVYTDKYLYDENDERMELKIRLNLASDILEGAQMKIFLQKGKKILWSRSNPEPEIDAIFDIRNIPFGIDEIVVVLEYRKMKIQTTVPFRKGKSPFYKELL